MVRAGEMRHQVELQVQSSSQNPTHRPAAQQLVDVRHPAGGGGSITRVRDLGERAAEWPVPVVFRLRYLDGVTSAMRLVFEGRVHNILSAIDQEALGEELVITAEELVGEAP
jgi:head-tail adaptor